MGRPRFWGILLFPALLAGSAFGQKQPRVPANQLVHQVVNHELQAEAQDHSHWMFRSQQSQPGGGTKTEEIVQTPQGWVRRLLAINGHPLTPQERAKDDQRLRKATSDPAQQRKELQSLRNDEAQAQQLMKMLPEAFLYTYAGTTGKVVKLNFRPNPSFHPNSRKAAVFHNMVGCLWLNVEQQRLAGINGHLNQEVKFAGGLLGHLDKGGSFQVRQTPIGDGYWDVTYMNVQMNGKALFFKTISVNEREIRSNYHRMPDNLTLAQAANLLEKQTNFLAQKR